MKTSSLAFTLVLLLGLLQASLAEGGLSRFEIFEAGESGSMELTDRKLGFADDIEIRVRHLKFVNSGEQLSAVCLLIPPGEYQPASMVRYIDVDELPQVLEALRQFEERFEGPGPRPDMRAYYVTRGQVAIGIKYYGKWKGILRTDGITRTFGVRTFRKLRAKLEEAASYL